MAIRAELEAAVGRIVEAAQCWQAAFEAWQGAVRVRDRLVERADRKVSQATGGLSVARWEAVCRRRCLHTVADATAKARAIRARPAVLSAVAARDRTLRAADASVLAARVELAEQSKLLSGFGTAGAALVGMGVAELAHLARRPRLPATLTGRTRRRLRPGPVNSRAHHRGGADTPGQR
jgi:hypothetical protein